METIYKVFTGKPVADLNLDYHKVTNLTHKLNEHCIYTHKNKISLQHSLNNNSQGAVLGATAHRQTWPTLLCFFRGLPGTGTYVNPSLEIQKLLHNELKAFINQTKRLHASRWK
jgi:hypothetical protein